MVKVKLSDKLSTAFYVLLEKGPMSISSVAEEVSKLVGSKTTTVRSQLSVVLPDLLEFGLVEEVGSDRFGSRLIDIAPKSVIILLLMLASGLRYRHLPWNSLIKYFNRRMPHLTKYVELLRCVVDVWNFKVFGPTTEEDYSDFLEDLASAALDLSKRFSKITEEDIKEKLFRIISDKLIECLREKCEDEALKKIQELGLTRELKEVIDNDEKRSSRLRRLLEKL